MNTTRTTLSPRIRVPRNATPGAIALAAIALAAFLPPSAPLAAAAATDAAAAGAATEVVQGWYFHTGKNTLATLPSPWQGQDAAGTSYADSAGTTSLPRLGHHGVSGWLHGENKQDETTNRGALFAHSGSSGNFTDSFVVVAPFASLPDSGFNSLSLATDNLLSLTWDMALSNTAMSIQVLVQVNNANWYASDSSFTVTTAGSNSAMTNAVSQSFDFTSTTTGLLSTNWRGITFGPTGIVLNSIQVADNLGDAITGIGFLINTGNASGRVAWIDNVELRATTTVPEPATWTLFTGAALLLLAAIRPRRRCTPRIS
jgi:hypothetical protein